MSKSQMYLDADFEGHFTTICMLVGNELSQCKERGDRCWERAWAMYTLADAMFGMENAKRVSRYIWDYVDDCERLRDNAMLEAAIIPAEPEVPLILQRKQHVIDVRVACNSEPVPGWGHDPQDMVKAAARAAAEVLGSYDPLVIGSEVKDLKVDDLTDSETAAILRHMESSDG